MNCPICKKPIPPATVLTCRRCWWLIPAQERIALGTMLREGRPTASKLASLAKRVREDHPEVDPSPPAPEPEPGPEIRTIGDADTNTL